MKKATALELPQARLDPQTHGRKLQRSKTLRKDDLVVQYTPYRDCHVHRRVVRVDHSRYFSHVWFEDGGKESYQPSQKVMVDRQFAFAPNAFKLPDLFATAPEHNRSHRRQIQAEAEDDGQFEDGNLTPYDEDPDGEYADWSGALVTHVR